MKPQALLFTCTLLALGACDREGDPPESESTTQSEGDSESSSDTADGSDTGTETSAGDGDGDETTTGGDGDGEGESVWPKECLLPCTEAIECLVPGPPPSPKYPFPLECTEGQCDPIDPCTSDDACAGEAINTACNVETGMCDFPCASDSDCDAAPAPWDEVCDTGLGVCISAPCTSDADCDAGQTCFADGGCREPCISTEACAAEWAWTGPENFTCDRGYCEYLGCNSDAECEAYTGIPGTVCG